MTGQVAKPPSNQYSLAGKVFPYYNLSYPRVHSDPVQALMNTTPEAKMLFCTAKHDATRKAFMNSAFSRTEAAMLELSQFKRNNATFQADVVESLQKKKAHLALVQQDIALHEQLVSEYFPLFDTCAAEADAYFFGFRNRKPSYYSAEVVDIILKDVSQSGMNLLLRLNPSDVANAFHLPHAGNSEALSGLEAYNILQGLRSHGYINNVSLQEQLKKYEMDYVIPTNWVGRTQVLASVHFANTTLRALLLIYFGKVGPNMKGFTERFSNDKGQVWAPPFLFNRWTILCPPCSYYRAMRPKDQATDTDIT